jgi:hypothetical protein
MVPSRELASARTPGERAMFLRGTLLLTVD